MIDLTGRAIADIGAALRLRSVWAALASEDVADSHRRTLFGPLWPLLNYVVFAGTIIVIFGPTTDDKNYAAYVASGLLVWLFISEMLTQSATIFVREENFIKGTTLPVSVYVLRQTLLTALRAGYAVPGAIVLIAANGVTPTAALLSVVPASVLIVLTAPAMAILFGFAGVFFRDFPLLIGHVMRILMFVTPIFWVHGGEGGLRGVLYHWNPLTHYIDIVRSPIVDGVVPALSWAISLSLSGLIFAAALLVLGKFNRQIVFLL